MAGKIDESMLIDEVLIAMLVCHQLAPFLAARNAPHFLIQASMTQFLICLEDVLQALPDEHRVNFTEYIHPTSRVDDVTHLVNRARAAACHIDSDQKQASPTTRYGFNVIPPADGKLQIFMDGVEFPTCEYEDDVLFMLGIHRVYLRRHLFRALEEAAKKWSTLEPHRMGFILNAQVRAGW